MTVHPELTVLQALVRFPVARERTVEKSSDFRTRWRRDLFRGTSGRDQLDHLRFSIVTNDFDVIVPVMTSIIERTATEVALLRRAIESHRRKKAILIKE